MVDRPNDRRHAATPKPRLFALMAEFDSVEPLLATAEEIRNAGYTKWDAHTPFPVHGLDAAMGIKPTRLPWIVFGAGLAGAVVALLLQWWTNAVDYPFSISGKPLFSLPANIPVTFEIGVLLSAFAAFFGALALSGLPELFHPLLHHRRFRRATDDRFYIVIESRDALFDEQVTRALLASCAPARVDTVTTTTTADAYKIPRMIVLFGIIGALASVVPLALLARAREAKSETPRLHVVPDMDWQSKGKPQQRSSLFEDSRVMRLAPAGTVAFGDLPHDASFRTGKVGEAWIAELPESLSASWEMVARGQLQFNACCAPCHGISGYGDGLTARKAEELAEGTWVPPTSVHVDPVRDQAIGQLFSTISYGIRNMPGYAAQTIQVDRWAIALYVKALQLSQNAPKQAVPNDKLPSVGP